MVSHNLYTFFLQLWLLFKENSLADTFNSSFWFCLDIGVPDVIELKKKKKPRYSKTVFSYGAWLFHLPQLETSQKTFKLIMVFILQCKSISYICYNMIYQYCMKLCYCVIVLLIICNHSTKYTHIHTYLYLYTSPLKIISPWRGNTRK